jgi:hypothetical protein
MVIHRGMWGTADASVSGISPHLVSLHSSPPDASFSRRVELADGVADPLGARRFRALSR